MSPDTDKEALNKTSSIFANVLKIEGNLANYRHILTFLSMIDAILSVIVIVFMGLFFHNCKTEGIEAINYNVTLEQIEFFYDALKDCGISQENMVPTSETICDKIKFKVAPITFVTCILNFLFAATFFTLPTKHGVTSLNDGVHEGRQFKRNKSGLTSLVLITFGTLLIISCGMFSLMFYNDHSLCWMNYSVSQRTKSTVQYWVTLAAALWLTLYKPLVLFVLLKYGVELVDDQIVDASGSATLNLAAQMEADSESQTEIGRRATNPPPEMTTVEAKYAKSDKKVAVLLFPEKNDEKEEVEGDKEKKKI